MRLSSWFKRPYPRLDWIQVEITSRCNGRCRYCPQHAWRRQWRVADMAPADFDRLIPAFKRTDLVYLQGWGEPFLHPDFFRMLAVAKGAGAKVGTTTNGTLVDNATADRLVSGGLDILAFSLAGISDNNDNIRQGTRLRSVAEAVAAVNRAKAAQGRGSPRIHIAFMLLRSQMDEIDRLPDFFAGLGVDQVVVSSLSLVATEAWAGEAVLAETPEAWTELKEKADAVREAGARQGVDLRFHLMAPWADPGPCDENIGRALVVGVNGDVSACVMTNLPLITGAADGLDPGYFPPSRLIFGNIRSATLAEIWRRPAYRSFRRRWAAVEPPAPCRGCCKSRRLTIDRPVPGPAARLVPDF